ncbi:hypothetical protein ACFYSC_04700 [Streptosporangium sp. NPDC004379]|uniref:hypothetical protein n=1 Tax=Streptosporangium sp. NPDC004379 TaxID=3366189 RepID=UPI0036BB420C
MAEGGNRRGLVFAVLVAMLAGVGVYLTMMSGQPGGEPAGQDPARADRATAQARARVSAEPPRPAATASDAPFDVYSYLPMTKQELAAAADYARRFTAAYGTYRYDEDPAAYGDRVGGYTTTEFADVLLRTFSSPGTIEANKADQVVSVGSAEVKAIRQVQDTSVTFVVTGTQKITTKAGPRGLTDDYAVTLIEVGTEWRVHNLEPADAGQEGDDRTSPPGEDG